MSPRQDPRSPRSRASRRCLGARCVASIALALALFAGAGDVRAERVHDLTDALLHGKQVKTRVWAATALDRMRDPRAVQPLIRALADRSFLVRAQAAAALGRLGDPVALPALQRALRDPRGAVRREAVAAIDLIRDKQRPRDADAPGAPVPAPDLPRPARAVARDSLGPRSPSEHQVYVVLKSASDKSGLGGTQKSRTFRARRLRSLMLDQLEASRDVVVVSSASRNPSIAPYAVDLTMVRLARVERGPNVEVECAIRATVSTREGKMLSVLTGGAKVQIPKVNYREAFLPQLRRDALEGAVRSVQHDMVAYLVKLPPPETAPPVAVTPSRSPGSALGAVSEERSGK